MNNSTLGNSSVFEDHFKSLTIISSFASPVFRLPINIYIIQLILSRHLITSEFYTFNQSIMELLMSLNDIVGMVKSLLYFNSTLADIRMFFLGFVITGRPGFLALICVERYIAIVKPVAFLRLKPLRCKLSFSGILWLYSFFCCLAITYMPSEFLYALTLQMTLFCSVMIYCCIAALLVLRKPSPGEKVKQEMGKMKRKAFRIIMIITISVIMAYIPFAIVIILKSYVRQRSFCNALEMCYMATIFSGFVQAMLFIQRFGKLSCFNCL